MDNENKKTRREFLSDVLKTGSVAAMGGLVSIGLSPEVSRANNTLDILSMTKVDPEMILYREISQPVSTIFAESRFLTVDDSGALYLAGDQSVRVMDSLGRIMETIKLTVSPFCLAPTDRHLYIGTRDRIIITDKKGEVLTTWPSLGDNAWITNIVVTDEHLYIADAGQRIVWCYDLKGNFVRRIGDKNPDRNIPGFVVPGPYFDLAMAPDGLLRIANPGRHQIEAYTIKETVNSHGDGSVIDLKTSPPAVILSVLPFLKTEA